MKFLELPLDIIRLIVDEIAPSEFRKDAGLLLVCKAWFNIVHPIYLSNLEFPHLRLSNRSLCEFPPQGSLRKLLEDGPTRSIAIRLIGHECDFLGKAWESTGLDDRVPTAMPDSDETEEHDDDDTNNNCDWLTKLCKAVGEDYEYPFKQDWEPQINHQLKIFADSLATGFKSLDEFMLVASREADHVWGGFFHQADYLYSTTIGKLLERLQGRNLTYVILDTCGSELLPDQDGASVHICPLVAQLLPTVKMMRLRLRTCCSAMIHKRLDTDSRLESLTIKLNHPYFPVNRKDEELFCSSSCRGDHPKHGRAYMHEEILRSAMDLCMMVRTRDHRKQKLRRLVVSFKAPPPSTINIIGVDCVTGEELYVAEEVFTYEDDGRPFWWEDSSGTDLLRPRRYRFRMPKENIQNLPFRPSNQN